MSSVDLESLLYPVSELEPSGPDLEYDSQAAELDQAARGKPEQQYGDTLIPAEEPDWSMVRRLASDLLLRTKDLRIAVHLGNACLGVGTLSDYRDVTKLLLSYLTDFWDTIHPQLDPDDDNDPTERINAISSMKDPSTTIRLIKHVELISMPGIGAITYHDFEVARGDIPAAEDSESLTMSTIEGVFQDCDVDVLAGTATAAEQIKSNLSEIEAALTNQVGSTNSVSLEPLVKVVDEIGRLLSNYVQQRDTGEVPSQVDTQVDADGVAAPTNGATTQAAASVNHAEIRGREDVIRAIDRICEYYAKHEPSSPLPLLLNRAKRLATKSFVEIIQDLTPDAIEQALQIEGRQSDEDND